MLGTRDGDRSQATTTRAGVAQEHAPQGAFDRNAMQREDLWWFFNDSASDLGERSNFASMIAMIEGGGGRSAGGLDGVVMMPVESDEAMRAAKRWRRVNTLLDRCEPTAAAMLQAFHTQRNRGDLNVEFPDGFAGVVLLLLGGRKARKPERLELLERARRRRDRATALSRRARGGDGMNIPAEMSIQKLAVLAGVSHTTAWRRIHALHAKHGDVLIDVGLKRRRVSTARLLKYWKFRGVPITTTSEVERLTERLERVEKKLGIALRF